MNVPPQTITIPIEVEVYLTRMPDPLLGAVRGLVRLHKARRGRPLGEGAADDVADDLEVLQTLLDTLVKAYGKEDRW